MAVETTPRDLPLASLKQELIDSLPDSEIWANSDTCVVGNLMLLEIVGPLAGNYEQGTCGGEGTTAWGEFFVGGTSEVRVAGANVSVGILGLDISASCPSLTAEIVQTGVTQSIFAPLTAFTDVGVGLGGGSGTSAVYTDTWVIDGVTISKMMYDIQGTPAGLQVTRMQSSGPGTQTIGLPYVHTRTLTLT